MIAVEKIACDDVTQYQELFQEWSTSVTQLSKGKFGFRERRFRLPDLDLSWHSFEQANEAVEVYMKPGLSVSIILESESFYRFDGKELQPNCAFVHNESDCSRISIGGRADVVELQISPDLLADLGWTSSFDRLHTVDIENRNELVREALGIFRNMAQTEPDTAMRIQAGLLERIGRLLHVTCDTLDGPELRSGSTFAGCEIVRRADNWFSRLPAKRPVMALEVSRELGISERSLYRAFNSWVGVGPALYFEIKRLHGLRRELQTAKGPAKRVSDIAESHGFSNPGRMASRYFELFHQYPIETVQQARQGW